MKKMLSLLGGLGCILCAHAQVIHVPSDYSTIQAAINTASAGDTVIVDEGTYLENIDYKGKAISVASRFILDGDTSHISRTIIDGSNPDNTDRASTVTMLQATDTTSVLCGFTIRGGSGTGDFETIFSGVFARFGGGVASAGGKIVHNIIRDNHVAHRQVASGAGIAAGEMQFLPPSTHINIVIRNNEIFQNNCHTEEHYAQAGGIGLTIGEGVTIVERNNIHHNSTRCEDPYKAMSGGMAVGHTTSSSGTGIIRNNHIHHNEAHSDKSFGGGIFYILFAAGPSDQFTPGLIYNNIIESNHSQNFGGGISIWYLGIWDLLPPLDPVIVNNTFVNNEAVHGTGISVVDAKVLMFNNIMCNPSGDDNAVEIYDNLFRYCPGYAPQWCRDENLADVYALYSDVRGGWNGTGNMDTIPVFQPGSFDLAEGDMCIGRGTDSVEFEGRWYTAPTHDYYGNIRPNPVDNKVDLGATESPYRISFGLGEEPPPSGEIQLYPNPTKHLLTIIDSQPGMHTLIISSLNGKILMRGEFYGTTHQVDLSPFEDGVYLISIQTRNAAIVRKIAKL